MKKFRKLTAVITALCLAGSMMATMSMLNVSADTTYSITITNNGDNASHTYEAYQIFKGDLSGAGTEEDPYILSNVTWGDGVDTTTTVDGKTLLNAIKNISVDSTTTPFSSVTDASSVANVLSNYGNDSAMAKEFASVVGKYLSDTTTGTYSSNKITDLSAGYYLVQDASNPTGSDPNSGAKTRYILKVAGDVEVETKNSAPSVIKKVKENTKEVNKDGTATDGVFTVDAQYNDVADYNIGDTVPFKLYGSLPSTYNDYDTYYYEFSDTLGSEFTVDEDSFTVKVINGDTATEVPKIDGNGKRNCNVIVSGSNIRVLFANTKNLTDNDGNKIQTDANSIITVEYNAVLNDTAKIGLPGQENAVKLVYANNPNNNGGGWWSNNGTDDVTDDYPIVPTDDDGTPQTGETPEDQVIVFTYELDITKVDGSTLTGDGKTDENTEYLKDAEFVLHKENNHGSYNDLVPIYKKETTTGEGENAVTTYEYIVGIDKDGEGTDWTLVTENNPLKTDKDGKIKIQGLDDGTYYLEETKAPAGYNALTVNVKLEIEASTKNGQNWTEVPSEALNSDVDGQGAVKLIVDGSSTPTYSLVTGSGESITDDGTVNALIENNKGSTLPGTGGIGTTIFYMVGGVLVVGAGVTLIAKKRAKNEQ